MSEAQNKVHTHSMN